MPERTQLEQWRRELRSRSRGVGYQAADRLAQSGPLGQEILRRALDSRDRQVRMHAAWAVRLLDSPEAVIRLVELLRQDREFYLALQQALPAQPDPTLLEPLLAAARDPKNAQRKFHVMLLGDVQGPGVLDALLLALQADDRDLQEGAFLAFKHSAPELRRSAGPPLVQALSVRLPLPRYLPWALTRRARARHLVPLSLIAAVGVVGGSAGVGVLCEILRSDAHPDYRLAAISALVTVGESAMGRCWRALLEVVRQPGHPELEGTAAEALRRLRVREAEPDLLELLRVGKPTQRRNAAHALEGCGGPDSLPQLVVSLTDQDVHVRRTVARTLGKLPIESRAREGLLGRLSDPDKWVGWNAAWALGRHSDHADFLVPRLVASLESRERALVRHSALALGQLKVRTPEAVEALVAVLDGPADIARAAAWALRRLDLAEALTYATQLSESPDRRQRRLGKRARQWLRPERASYAPGLPIRSARLSGVVVSPDEQAPTPEGPKPPGEKTTSPRRELG